VLYKEIIYFAIQYKIVGYLTEFKRKLFAEITNVPEAVKGAYYPSLDGLRGIAIMMVILISFWHQSLFKPFSCVY
jgi:hypothetical protein